VTTRAASASASASAAPATRAATLLAVILAAASLLAGCGSGQPSQRPGVAHYIRQIDRIESQLKAPMNAVTRAGSDLASTPGKATLLGNLVKASSRETLASAESEIKVARAHLGSLGSPPAASHLRSLVLTLTAGEADLTHQLWLLSSFLPRFGAVLTPLGPAALSLERVLSQRSAYGSSAVLALYGAKARALRAFQRTTAEISARLRRLQAPRVSAPAYRAELDSLRGMGQSAGRLAAALVGGRPGNVQRLLIAFDRAAAATHTPAVARAQGRAIKAYDADTTRLSRLSQAIASERLRLSKTLS
jgi:hypothetical protein